MEEGEKEEKIVLRHGWLTKSPRLQIRRIKRWKTRYFVFCEIKSGTRRWLHLFYYRDYVAYKKRKMPEDCIDISEASDIGIGKEEIDGHKHIINIQIPGRLYHLSAASCDDMFNWNLILRAYKFNDMSMLENRPEQWHQSRSDYEIIQSNCRLKQKFLYCSQCGKAMKTSDLIPDNLYINMPPPLADDATSDQISSSGKLDMEPEYIEINDDLHPHPYPSENTIHDYENITGQTWIRELSKYRVQSILPLEHLFDSDGCLPKMSKVDDQLDQSKEIGSNNSVRRKIFEISTRHAQKKTDENDSRIEESNDKLKIKKTNSAPIFGLEKSFVAPRANSVGSSTVSRYQIDYRFPNKVKETEHKIESPLAQMRTPVQESEENYDGCESIVSPAIHITKLLNSNTSELVSPVGGSETTTSSRKEPQEHGSSGNESSNVHEIKTFLITRV